MTVTASAPKPGWNNPLVAADRCDKCGSQAYIRATLLTGGELLFCAHHGKQYGPELIRDKAQLYSEVSKLQELVRQNESTFERG